MEISSGFGHLEGIIMVQIHQHRTPDFIGIGFRRCASSWLHSCMTEHPDIGKPPNGLHFFSENHERGTCWYENELATYATKTVVGEFSVSYTYPDVYKNVANRIARHYPNAKLFCIVRNPVYRAYSDYLRSVSLSEINKTVSFEEAISRWPILVERGFYGRILRYYEKLFPNNLLILLYDEISKNHSRLLRHIYSYLDVNPSYVPSLASIRKGQAFLPKNQKTQLFITALEQTLSHSLRPLRLGFMLDVSKALGLQKMVRGLNRQTRAPMKPETRRKLWELYRNDMEELSRIAGREVPWLGEVDG